MCEFIKAMEENKFLELPSEMLEIEEIEEEILETSSDDFLDEHEYWFYLDTIRAEDQDNFNAEITAWESKRVNRKFQKNSRFKNKLRDKGNLFFKGFRDNDFSKKLEKLNIVKIEKCKPYHRSYMSQDHDIQYNGKEFFLGKRVNLSSWTVEGQRVGFVENPKGNAAWRKAYKQRDQAKEKEAYKAEILDGTLLFASYDEESLDVSTLLPWDPEHPDFYDFETDIMLPENKEADNFWEYKKIKEVSELIEEQKYLNFSSQDYYQEMNDAYLSCDDDFWDRFDDDWEY